MSSYTGLYVLRLNDGTIHSVQVVDPSGNSIPLNPEIYIERQVKPPIEHLPDIDEYTARSSEPKISPVILALADWVKGVEVSSKALYTMQQFGFIFPDQTGQLQLTPSGGQTLRDHGLI